VSARIEKTSPNPFKFKDKGKEKSCSPESLNVALPWPDLTANEISARRRPSGRSRRNSLPAYNAQNGAATPGSPSPIVTAILVASETLTGTCAISLTGGTFVGC
jgi:hypothetical protein